jgi:hypothetical protein
LSISECPEINPRLTFSPAGLAGSSLADISELETTMSAVADSRADIKELTNIFFDTERRSAEPLLTLSQRKRGLSRTNVKEAEITLFVEVLRCAAVSASESAACTAPPLPPPPPPRLVSVF